MPPDQVRPKGDFGLTTRKTDFEDDRGELGKALAELSALQEGQISRERHGAGELVRRNGIPVEATDCLQLDGTLTAARCLSQQNGLADEERVWSRPVAAGSSRRRRGHLRVESGIASRFFDEPAADVPRTVQSRVDDLGIDMAASARFRTMVQESDVFAALLYAALCNTGWVHKRSGQRWHVSWRGAGRTVAHLRGQGDYMDWYLGGEECTMDENVLGEIQILGWALYEGG